MIEAVSTLFAQSHPVRSHKLGQFAVKHHLAGNDVLSDAVELGIVVAKNSYQSV
jgi:hypothetical protein